MSRTKAVLTNENGQLITEDIKSVVNDVNKLSAGAMSQRRDLEDVVRRGSYNGSARGERTKKDLEKKINNLRKKYNIN